jgi:hypothetical protein
MPIEIIGPSWPSTRTLRHACEGVETRDGSLVRVSWGVQGEGLVNGMARLDAIEQLTAFEEYSLALIRRPIFATDVEMAKEWIRQGEMVFGRKLHHSQGRDIQGPGRHAPHRFRRKWLESEWWSLVVPDIVEEWRIHAMRGRNGEYRVIARGKKVQVDPPSRLLPVRSRSNGFRMVHNLEPPDSVREVGRRAVEACGYDFGGADVYVCEDGTVGVFEVNRAVGLSPYTSTQYARAFAKYLPYPPTT